MFVWKTFLIILSFIMFYNLIRGFYITIKEKKMSVLMTVSVTILLSIIEAIVIYSFYVIFQIITK